MSEESDQLVQSVQRAIETVPFNPWNDELRAQTLREFYEGTYVGDYADVIFKAVARAAVAVALNHAADLLENEYFEGGLAETIRAQIPTDTNASRNCDLNEVATAPSQTA